MSNAMSLKAKIRNIAKQKNIPAQVILQNYMFQSTSQYSHGSKRFLPSYRDFLHLGIALRCENRFPVKVRGTALLPPVRLRDLGILQQT